MGYFNKRKGFKRVAQEVLLVRHFITDQGSGKFLRKFNEITKVSYKEMTCCESVPCFYDTFYGVNLPLSNKLACLSLSATSSLV